MTPEELFPSCRRHRIVAGSGNTLLSIKFIKDFNQAKHARRVMSGDMNKMMKHMGTKQPS